MEFENVMKICLYSLAVIFLVQIIDVICNLGLHLYLGVLFFGVVFFILFYTLQFEKNDCDCKNKNSDKGIGDEEVKLDNMQKEVNMEYEENGLTDEVLDKQVEINSRRNELDIPDKYAVVNEEGFVQ